MEKKNNNIIEFDNEYVTSSIKKRIFNTHICILILHYYTITRRHTRDIDNQYYIPTDWNNQISYLKKKNK